MPLNPVAGWGIHLSEEGNEEGHEEGRADGKERVTYKIICFFEQLFRQCILHKSSVASCESLQGSDEAGHEAGHEGRRVSFCIHPFLCLQWVTPEVDAMHIGLFNLQNKSFCK